MQTVSIPGTYLELAKAEGIPTSLATEAFIARTNRKPVLSIGDRLAQLEGHTDQRDARRRLRRLWQNWTNANGEGFVAAPDESLTTMAIPSSPDVPEKTQYADYLERSHAAYERIVGQTMRVKKNDQPLTTDRMVLGGDIHGMFVNPEALEAFCSDPAERAVIMGDITDMYAASRYSSTIDHITVRKELAQARMVMERIACSFKEVKVIPGNHDNRPLKRLQEMFPQLLPLIVNPVELLIRGLDNVEMLSYTVPNSAPMDEMLLPYGNDVELDFLALVGDIAVGHFEGFYGKDAPAKCEKWLSDWSHILELPQRPRLVAQAHTHRLSMELTPKGNLIVGTGCLCRAQAYQFHGHAKYQPPVTGYVAVYQDESGRTDLGKTQLIPL